MNVRRDHAFTDAANPLSNAAFKQLVLPWAGISFTGETGEGNGTDRDWFTEAVNEIVNPQAQLFVRSSSGVYTVCITQKDRNKGTRHQYKALGKLLSLAVVHGRPLAYNGILIGRNPTLDDLTIEDPVLAQSLKFPGELDMFPIQIEKQVFTPTVANRHDLLEKKLSSIANRA